MVGTDGDLGPGKRSRTQQLPGANEYDVCGALTHNDGHGAVPAHGGLPAAHAVQQGGPVGGGLCREGVGEEETGRSREAGGRGWDARWLGINHKGRAGKQSQNAMGGGSQHARSPESSLSSGTSKW